MSSVKKGKGRRSDDNMEDDSDEKDTKRKCRNLSEKKRRDQFNLLVNELNSMVSDGGKKMDKSTILSATIGFLRNHNEVTMQSQVHEIKEDWKPRYLTNEEFIHLVLESVDGFIIIFSTSGQIYYASDNITSVLGHTPSEVLNMTVYEMAPEEEQTSLYNTLLNRIEEQSQISFSCYLKRGCAASKPQSYYERVNFVGYVRPKESIIQVENEYEEGDSKSIFVGTGRLQNPQLIREMSLLNQIRSEFTSRHSLEWKFLFLDHRAPPLIGYLPFELLGTSGYDYYHVDDLDKVMSCHEALMQKGKGTSCYYRFLTKGQQWIWLQSRFYITYHQWNSKPEFIVCSHRVISYADVLQRSITTSNNEECGDISSTQLSSNDSSYWATKACSRKINFASNSSCKSMPADSLGPISINVNAQSSDLPNDQSKFLNISDQSNTHQFQQYVEPLQYVATIPIQPVITNYAPPVILSPVASVAPVLPSTEMNQEQNLFQADLQRKHAELQASIGEQQAQLRAVSEQLLMARLGLMPSQPQSSTNMTSFSYSCTGTVSSTTTFAGSTITAVVPTVTLVPSIPQNDVLTPLVPIQQNLSEAQLEPLYLLPDSNTPPTLEELK